MKTSELTGAALDWAVAKCEGYFEIDMAVVRAGIVRVHYFDKWCPSTDWAQGGPIIEREKIRLDQSDHPEMWPWFAHKLIGWEKRGEAELGEWPVYAEGGGDTLLIAAMRCYVASKLGDEIDVPEGLA